MQEGSNAGTPTSEEVKHITRGLNRAGSLELVDSPEQQPSQEEPEQRFEAVEEAPFSDEFDSDSGKDKN